MYKRLIGRLFILGTLMAGIVMVAPQPAHADECFDECFPAYQQCVQLGEFGCQEVYLDCLCSCRGTC